MMENLLKLYIERFLFSLCKIDFEQNMPSACCARQQNAQDMRGGYRGHNSGNLRFCRHLWDVTIHIS